MPFKWFWKILQILEKTSTHFKNKKKKKRKKKKPIKKPIKKDNDKSQ